MTRRPGQLASNRSGGVRNPLERVDPSLSPKKPGQMVRVLGRPRITRHRQSDQPAGERRGGDPLFVQHPP
jgi:hypothetical protein